MPLSRPIKISFWSTKRYPAKIELSPGVDALLLITRWMPICNLVPTSTCTLRFLLDTGIIDERRVTLSGSWSICIALELRATWADDSLFCTSSPTETRYACCPCASAPPGFQTSGGSMPPRPRPPTSLPNFHALVSSTTSVFVFSQNTRIRESEYRSSTTRCCPVWCMCKNTHPAAAAKLFALMALPVQNNPACKEAMSVTAPGVTEDQLRDTMLGPRMSAAADPVGLFSATKTALFLNSNLCKVWCVSEYSTTRLPNSETPGTKQH
mmetsp:Transcript_58275/g.134563  ORF Transcript_58275/g.134563 Transcript_58275/m.134563 type:complete len:267 (-) Transcript_58275:73-873(-)